MNSPDPSPHSQVERFEVTGNPDNGKPEMVRCPNPLGGGWVRHTEHRAALLTREAELEKERDEARGQTEAMAWAAGWGTDGCPPFEFAAVETEIRERGHDDSRDYQDALDRAETSEHPLADARAELERLAKVEDAKWERGGDTYCQGQAQGLRKAAALLIATPCSDQGGDDDESAQRQTGGSTVVTGGGPEPDGGSAPATSQESAVKVVVDFLDAWRFCPVSAAPAPVRSCLEDAATQLLAALDAAPETSPCSDREGETEAAERAQIAEEDELARAMFSLDAGCTPSASQRDEARRVMDGRSNLVPPHRMQQSTRTVQNSSTQPAVPVPQEEGGTTWSEADAERIRERVRGRAEGSEDWPEEGEELSWEQLAEEGGIADG